MISPFFLILRLLDQKNLLHVAKTEVSIWFCFDYTPFLLVQRSRIDQFPSSFCIDRSTLQTICFISLSNLVYLIQSIGLVYGIHLVCLIHSVLQLGSFILYALICSCSIMCFLCLCSVCSRSYTSNSEENR